jgi:hypothetical protein
MYKLREWIPVENLGWVNLSHNQNAISFLEKNPNKIHWMSLSMNPNAVHLL